MTKTNLNWFPPHMRKAMKVVTQTLKQVDLVFEMRDARIPFSSRNVELEQLATGRRKKIILLNKADLIDKKDQIESLRWMASQKEEAHLICSREQESVKKLMNEAFEDLKTNKKNDDILLAMIVGVPNCGKSSLVNAMRAESKSAGLLHPKKDTQKVTTGPLPGVTKTMSAFQVFRGPPSIYMLDTPGIMIPKLTSLELACKLAITRAIPEDITGAEALARFFILQLLKGNQSIRFKPHPHHTVSRVKEDRKLAHYLDYSTRMYHGVKGIGEEQVHEVLHDTIGNFFGSAQEDIGTQDVLRVCQRIVSGVREGSYGRYMFDDLSDLQRKKDIRDNQKQNQYRIDKELIKSIGSQYLLDDKNSDNEFLSNKKEQDQDADKEQEGQELQEYETQDEYGYTTKGLVSSG